MNNERIVFLNSLHLKKNLLNKYLKLLEIDNKKILNLEYHHKIRQVINSFIFDINLEEYGSLFNKFYENRINKELILEKFDNIIDIFYDDMNKVDYMYNLLGDETYKIIKDHNDYLISIYCIYIKIEKKIKLE
jgi:hypothetical protein